MTRGTVKFVGDEHSNSSLICTSNSARRLGQNRSFWRQIVTGDANLVRNRELESKRQSNRWKHPSSPVKIFMQQSTTNKTMLTFFLEHKGSHSSFIYRKHGQTSIKKPMLNFLLGHKRSCFNFIYRKHEQTVTTQRTVLCLARNGNLQYATKK